MQSDYRFLNELWANFLLYAASEEAGKAVAAHVLNAGVSR